MATNKRRKLAKGAAGLLALCVLLVGVATMGACTTMGSTAEGERLEKMKASPQWGTDRFENELPRNKPPMGKILVEWVTGGSDQAEPERGTLPVVRRSGAEFDELPENGLRVTWFGHSTMLVEIDGKRVLIDPVWGERASPFGWMGPKRFTDPLMPLQELPELDAVLISHDHYDHLDHPTVVELAKRDVKWVVPLGVGAHLEYWGVPAQRIVELDWWGEHQIGDVRLVATPARHMSGRSVTMADQDHTLWAGWAMVGPEHRVYFSGDTAMFPGFAEIGERLGPFDLAMIESGAYNQMWSDVHLGPEQAVEANRMVRGKVMMPVHWGMFDLALHSWVEPIERVLVAAARYGTPVVTPMPGESLNPSQPEAVARWWPQDVSWETAQDAPVKSSHLDELEAHNHEVRPVRPVPAAPVPAMAIQ